MSTISRLLAAQSRTERIVLALAGLVFLGAAGWLFWMWIDRITVIIPARGGSWTEGMVGQPTYANPLLAESDADRALIHLLFNNALDLAERTETDETGRIWKVRLKEGLRWSDGAKITSDDIIFTVQKIQDPETRSPLFSSWQGVTVNRVSELETQFVLVSSYPFFVENLRNLYPIPKHLFADTPSANWRLSKYNLETVGSGPYEFDTYAKRSDGFIERYDTKVNPDYTGDAPHLDRFSFRYFPKTEDALAAFNAGTVDAFGKFDPNILLSISRSYKIVPYSVPSYYGVFFNQGQNPALRDQTVRFALQQAVDRRSLVDSVFGGKARVANGPFVSGDESGPDTLFDRNAAIAGLEAAGWKPGDDGVRQKTAPDGTVKLQFDMIVPKIDFLQTTAERVRDMWAQIGAKVNLLPMDSGDVTDRIIKNREYQAILFGNFLNPAFDLYPFWHTNERFYPGLNLAMLSDKNVDQLIETVRREPNDTKRAREISSLQAAIVSSSPAVFLYSPDFLYVVNRGLKGIEPQVLAEPADRYQAVPSWHLHTTRALR